MCDETVAHRILLLILFPCVNHSRMTHRTPSDRNLSVLVSSERTHLVSRLDMALTPSKTLPGYVAVFSGFILFSYSSM